MTNMFNSPDQSPNMFEPPKKGPGGKKMNHRPAIIGAILVFIFLAVVYYGIDLKNNTEAMVNEAAIEKGKGTGPATVPIERPQGPDVDPVQVVTQIPPIPAAPGVPLEPSLPPMLSEAEREAQKKKVADFEASVKASSRVQGTNMSQRGQQQQSQQSEQVAQRGLTPPPPPAQHMEDGTPVDINQNAQKQAFLNQSDDSSPYLKHTRMAPLGEFELKAGSVIPIVTITTFNSNVPGGLAVAQVRENVYDTTTKQHVLIPAGAKVYGVGDSNIAAGQVKVMTAYQRIVFPDGSSVILDRMPGMDKDGSAGFGGEVDNHYLRIFGQAALISLFTAASQLSQTQSPQGNFSASQILAAQVGMQGFSLGSQLIRRNLNIQPTILIPAGSEGNIGVMKDIILPPWRGHSLASNVSSVDQ